MTRSSIASYVCLVVLVCASSLVVGLFTSIQWLSLERLAWAFVIINAFGMAVNAVGLLWPRAIEHDLQWRRWTARLDLAANLAFMAWIVLSVMAMARYLMNQGL